ncbi:Putative lipase ATG15 [Fulvia fulva]|uniref:triacylglycerol lipase n=1 Tax=Passalora fulva TaxID=5499 RepID=A0A9Q8PCD1_PASFU|nr:Putative lipase ATG15 [Fulvia fulva]UJO19878.1 Putative lipase ATG15 [Fulvia fulva]
MRCTTYSPSALSRAGFLAMIWNGRLVLACVLLIAGCSGQVDAARTREQRKAFGSPNIVLPPGPAHEVASAKPARALGEKTFTLRHVYHHGTHNYPNLHRYIDIQPESKLQVSYDDGTTYEEAEVAFKAKAQSRIVQRMAHRSHSDIDAVQVHYFTYGQPADVEWTEDEIAGPNISDKITVLTFAKMAANAYIFSRKDGEWQPVKGGFNYTDDFGWEQDGLRGHIFADEANSTVVIGLKGTSPAIFDGADTTGNDKLNDNLFGSCCCAQGGPFTWKKVCDCAGSSAYTCNNTCLVKSLREKGHYYWAVKDLYRNVTERYPDSEVWLSGHSLGGVVSSLLGLTYGLPTLTFEAFPDAMAASRLGLPTPPGYKIGSHQARPMTGIHHFGHTADPIYMGSCNGGTSFCSIGGYAFEGVCHTGETCTYDTVRDLGWRVGIGTHKIVSVIKDVIKVYDQPPSCEQDVECVDCYNWKYFENNGTETTTSKASTATSTTTRTRTETCKTPGWWGCLDESTTSAPTTSTSTSSSTSSTRTCETPGWFGCKDETTTTSSSSSISSPSATPAPTITTTSSLPTSTSTSTCKTPGWFGCYDESTTTSATPKPSSTARTVTKTKTTTSDDDDCTSREWFGLICVDPSPTTASGSSPSSTNLPTTRRKMCTKRHWYGTCKQWRFDDFDPKNDL